MARVFRLSSGYTFTTLVHCELAVANTNDDFSITQLEASECHLVRKQLFMCLSVKCRNKSYAESRNAAVAFSSNQLHMIGPDNMRGVPRMSFSLGND